MIKNWANRNSIPFGMAFATLALLTGSAKATESLVVERSAIIDKSCVVVWDFVGRFSTIDNIVPMITNVEVDGDSVGAIRTLTLANGAIVKERLEALEANSYSYVFTEHPFPVSKYGATISVEDATEGKCRFNWTGKLVAKGISDDEVRGLFGDIYDSGIAEILKQFP